MVASPKCLEAVVGFNPQLANAGSRREELFPPRCGEKKCSAVGRLREDLSAFQESHHTICSSLRSCRHWEACRALVVAAGLFPQQIRGDAEGGFAWMDLEKRSGWEKA